MTGTSSGGSTGGSRRRVVVLVLALAGGAAFVVANASTLRPLRDGLSGIDRPAATAGLLFSVAAMVNRGLLNRAAHQAVGLDVPAAAMTRTAAVGFTANKIVKSAGVSGLAVLVHSGHRRGFDTPPIVAASMVTAAASFLALGLLLATASLSLALDGDLEGWWLAAGIGFAIYLLGVVTVLAVAARHRDAARRVHRAAIDLVRRVRRRPARREPGAVANPVDSFYDAMSRARSRGDALGRTVLHAVASKTLGVMMLLAAADAAGVGVSARTGLVIYAAALGASLVAFVPGGVGVVEASTSALLVAAGAGAGPALLAVALYRILDVWLPVAVGAALGRAELRDGAISEPTPTGDAAATVAYA